MSPGEQGQHPAGRRPAGEAAELRGDPLRAWGEPDQGELGERGAAASAEARDRRRADRRLHAGPRRLRAGGDDPRASALPAHRDHLRLGDPDERARTCCAATRRARWTTCRCRSCRNCCAPRCGCSPICIARRASSSSSTPSWNGASRSAPRSWRRPMRNWSSASRSARANARWRWRRCTRCRSWRASASSPAAWRTISTTC